MFNISLRNRKKNMSFTLKFYDKLFYLFEIFFL